MLKKESKFEGNNKESINKYHDLKKRFGDLSRETSGSIEEIKMFNNQLGRFTRCIINKFGDYRDENQDYLFWHALAGSGVDDEEKFTKFDFPGDYSVEKFLSLETSEEREALLKELEGREVVEEKKEAVN